MRNTAPQQTQLYSFFLMIYIFYVIFLSSFLMLCTDSVRIYLLLLSFLCTSLTLWIIFRDLLLILKISFLFILTTICAFTLSTLYPDYSIDGLVYHQSIANSVQSGVNIFFQTSGSFWGDLYPKGIEIFCGEVLKIFPSINSAAFFYILISTCLFFYSIYFGKLYDINYYKIYIASFLIAISPLFIQQFYTYYVDYCLYSLMCLLLLSSILIIHKKNNIIDIVIFITAGSICFVVKMSGAIYPFVALILLFTFQIFKRERFWMSIKTCFILGTIIFCIGFFVLGYNPYITNILNGRHVLYPIAGENKIDIITMMQPKNFLEKNRLSKLFTSLTSKTDNISNYGTTEFKLNIFTVSAHEKSQMGIPDTRIGGWGPLFTLILLISFGIPFFFKINTTILYPILFFIIISTVIHPESWWARYSPQIYLIPIAFFLSTKKLRFQKFHLISYIYMCFLIISMAINLTYFAIAKQELLNWNYKFYKTVFEQHNKGDITICIDEKKHYRERFSTDQLFKFYNVDTSKINSQMCASGKKIESGIMYFDIYKME